MKEEDKIFIEQWFKADNEEHRKAYAHLSYTGSWPKDFIPENVKFGAGWRFWIMSTLLDHYLMKEGLL